MVWNAPSMVHAEIAPPHLLRHVLKKRLPRDARVIHKETHMAERILHAAHHILYLRAVGNVRLKRGGAQSFGGKLRHERVGRSPAGRDSLRQRYSPHGQDGAPSRGRCRGSRR